jgi:hypothetical protein
MNHLGAAVVYLLCLGASAVCAGLLARTYGMVRSRLLLWTSISFVFLAINNLLLVADQLVFLQVDLWPYRQVLLLCGLMVLLFGFIWETL